MADNKIDYKEAKEFYEMFIEYTCQYPTGVRTYLECIADETWESLNDSFTPFYLKIRFIVSLKDIARQISLDGYKKEAKAIRDILKALIPQFTYE